MATIFGPDGQKIADATLELPVNGRTAQLRDLPRSNGLLAYYFGEGGRRVVVDTPDGRMDGRLNTRWERFGRAWEIVFSTSYCNASFSTDEDADDLVKEEHPSLDDRGQLLRP